MLTHPTPTPLDEVRPPLDAGIRPYVDVLVANGIETFESCEGGPGHACPEPKVRFYGNRFEGFQALAIAQNPNPPVADLRRLWPIVDGEPTGPVWELTFSVPAVRQPQEAGAEA